MRRGPKRDRSIPSPELPWHHHVRPLRAIDARPGRLRPRSFQTQHNPDVKVDGDVAGIADNQGTSGGGVTFYDVFDESSPTEGSYYDAGSGVNNHFISDDCGYLEQSDGLVKHGKKTAVEKGGIRERCVRGEP